MLKTYFQNQNHALILERQKTILIDYDDKICETLTDEDIDSDDGESSNRIMKINLSLTKASKFD